MTDISRRRVTAALRELRRGGVDERGRIGDYESEIRALRTRLVEREREIRSLGTRIAALQTVVTRSRAHSKRVPG